MLRPRRRTGRRISRLNSHYLVMRNSEGVSDSQFMELANLQFPNYVFKSANNGIRNVMFQISAERTEQTRLLDNRGRPGLISPSQPPRTKSKSWHAAQGRGVPWRFRRTGWIFRPPRVGKIIRTLEFYNFQESFYHIISVPS